MSDLCEHGRRKSMCSRCTAAFWATIPSQWPEVFARAAQMSDQPISPGPHDFDVHRRICTRCGATIGDWADGKAKECATGDLDLTGWDGLTTEQKAERRQRNIDQANARQSSGTSAAADDFAYINRKMAENEKAEADTKAVK